MDVAHANGFRGCVKPVASSRASVVKALWRALYRISRVSAAWLVNLLNEARNPLRCNVETTEMRHVIHWDAMRVPLRCGMRSIEMRTWNVERSWRRLYVRRPPVSATAPFITCAISLAHWLSLNILSARARPRRPISTASEGLSAIARMARLHPSTS